MLILRIKRAEVAMRDGRLDEAFEISAEEKVKAHRRGQALAGQVARALVKRGEEHLEAGRLAQAGSDCDRAQRLAGNAEDVAALRAKVGLAMIRKQQEDQRKAEAVLLARRQIEMGQLSVGEGVLREHFRHTDCDGEAETRHGVALQEAPGEFDGKAAALMHDVAARRSIVESVLEKAQAALKREDWENAVEQLVRAREQRVADARLGAMISQITHLLAERIQGSIKSGRLDVAALMMKRLGQVAERNLETEQTHQAMELCRTAWGRIERCELRRAEEAVRRLGTIVPGARWIEETVESLRKASDAMDELRGGALGLMDEGSGTDRTRATQVPPLQNTGGRERLRSQEKKDVMHEVPQKFVIQVDGVGSYLVLTGKRVSVGPVSGGQSVDVGIVAESNAPVMSIERQSGEGDYFLRAAAPVSVNEKMTSGKLLHSGDRVAASARCRLSFRVPSAASTTAVLDLHGARLMRGDIKRVILMDREVVIGPGAATHIRDDQMSESAVLYVHDGKLLLRTKDAWTVDGKNADRGTTIAVGSHVKVGEVTFVVTAA